MDEEFYHIGYWFLGREKKGFRLGRFRCLNFKMT